MIEREKLELLRNAIAELDEAETPVRQEISEIEERMERLRERWDVAQRKLNAVGDKWADRLDKTLPGWRALLLTPDA